MDDKVGMPDTPPAVVDNRPVTVSVSMLVYNHAKYLRKALDSVLMQNVDFRYQIGVGEDASQDNSQEILLEYANRFPERFCLILHPHNVGTHENVNSRLKFLTGEFIAPLEADDYWTDPNKLQKQVDFLRSHPDYSAVAHRVTVVDGNGDITMPADFVYSKIYCTESDYTLDHFSRYLMPGHTGSMLFRNFFLGFTPRQHQIYTDSMAMGDRKSSLVNVLSGKVHCMDASMSAYRRHQASWSGQSRPGGTSYFTYFESFALEKLAWDLFAVKIDFSKMRFKAWFGVVAFFVQAPSAGNFRAVLKVWRYGGKRLNKLLFLLGHILSYPVRAFLNKQRSAS